MITSVVKFIPEQLLRKAYRELVPFSNTVEIRITILNELVRRNNARIEIIQ